MSFDETRSGSPPRKRIAVRVTRDALRQIRGGHPWVFDGSITSISHNGAAGDLAVIFDDRRKFAAIGLWDPDSPIRIKILHAGHPIAIDIDFWTQLVTAAVDLRKPLIESPTTNGIRLIHGENDGLPGLVLDQYDDVAVLKLYTSAWFPHLHHLTSVIADLISPASLVMRTSRNIAKLIPDDLAQGTALIGPLPHEPTMFVENDLLFEAHPITGQKTGHFLDQRDNRQMVRELSDGARVLDVFSCTGGFSVHAAAGGAATVHSIDLSPSAVEASTRNFAHNRHNTAVASCRHTTTVGDAFEAMDTLAAAGERFDMVIVDPPSFAQRQANVAAALHAYSRLTLLALDLISDNGLLVQASCSSRVTADDFHHNIDDTATRANVQLVDVARTDHCLDHPIGFSQGAYLKARFARVHRH